jgi:ABC-2 type transport system permease protein
MAALRSYALLVKWQALRSKGFLPFAIVIQAFFSLGIVVGFPLLFPEMDETTILYLATGAPAITLITMGLVAVPQVVAQAKTEGTLDYMRTLPIPRVVYLMADLTVQLAIVLPGVVFGVVIAALWFDLPLRPSPLVGPSVVLVVLTATAVGYGLAAVLPPLMANLLSQVLVVLVFMFSPLNFPAERLPDWLAALHSVLPIQAMGEVLRGTLAPQAFPLTAGAFAMLTAWAVGSFLVTWRILSRRG